MIEYRQGDLFQSGAEALVNTVNCIGVMGGGIALQFKQKFPKNYLLYKTACAKGLVRPGKMFVTSLEQQQDPDNFMFLPRYIVNFPTKRHNLALSSLIADVEVGLDDLMRFIEDKKVGSIAIPALGCGLGGLNWGDVKPFLEKVTTTRPNVQFLVYPPQ